MTTNNTASTFTQQDVSSNVPDPVIDILESIEPPEGSNYTSFKGSATVEVHNLIPGWVVGIGKVSRWAPYEDSEEQVDKCRFPDYKNDFKDATEKRKPYIWFRRETAPGEKQDRSLHFKILGRIRQAIEAYQGQQSPDGQLDELPQDTTVSDSDIPF